jgi:hypothetical protein
VFIAGLKDLTAGKFFATVNAAIWSIAIFSGQISSTLIRAKLVPYLINEQCERVISFVVSPSCPGGQWELGRIRIQERRAYTKEVVKVCCMRFRSLSSGRHFLDPGSKPGGFI